MMTSGKWIIIFISKDYLDEINIILIGALLKNDIFIYNKRNMYIKE